MGGAAVSWRAFADPTSKTLVDILSGELNREFSFLKAKADPAPYYMAYEVVEQQGQSLSATLGALLQNTRSHERGVDTTVRVGSPSFDNYHPYKSLPIHFTSFTALSLDDDANQIRRTLWSETDRVYRLASRRFTQLKTDQQLLVESKEKNADFSSEEAETAIRSSAPLQYDAKAWTDRIRSWSAEFKNHPKILGSGVNFSARREIRTLVNTEGTAVEEGNDLFRLEVNGIALTPDGMDVRVFDTIEASEIAHFPDAGKIEARVRKVASTLDALVQAPPVEPMLCPAILSGRASAVFFHEIFGHRIEGHRQKDVSEGQTFKLGQQVLPPFMNVQSDPTKRSYNGFDLIGYYDFDDEGVKARPVKVVENGILKTFLLSRSPVGEFALSNAHGRRQPGFEVVSRQSNLIVESSKQVSTSDLRAALIAEIKRQGKPYGLYFEEVSSGYTTTGRGGLQAFTVVPLVVYRVYPDGRPDELVRGADIVGTPLSSFQKILATSDRPEVFNGYCGAESGSVPVSAVSPAILVSEIEIQRKQNAQQKLPLLPPPT
ncbi:MAG: TldD/PmbA family protein [Acidobacteriaceae bacterium]|nr:TldD/PmbA family protein [Acidobacteriaceae bacterium]